VKEDKDFFLLILTSFATKKIRASVGIFQDRVLLLTPSQTLLSADRSVTSVPRQPR